MKTICSLLLLLLFAPTVHAADAPKPFQATFAITFTSQPKFALAGMLDNSLGGRWDNQTQTLRIAAGFGIGTEKFFLPDANDIGGFKYNLPRGNALVLLLGRRNGDPSTKPRDVYGNVLGVHETVVLLAFRKTF